LQGVGSEKSGQWIEHDNPEIMHLRRRVTIGEEKICGTVRDIRGTLEEETRLATVYAVMKRTYGTSVANKIFPNRS